MAVWQNEAEITKEQKYGRQEAAKRIRECAKNKSTRLDLSWLGLDSLPIGIFEYLTQLRIFYLTNIILCNNASNE